VNAEDARDLPDALDALAAAPEHHRKLLENDKVRVLETHIGPGERTPVHTHCWPSAQYVLATTDFVRRDAEGTVVFDTRTAGGPKPGDTLWSEPLGPHSIENLGANELLVIMVELKAAG
jgi:hypothetical protein